MISVTGSDSPRTLVPRGTAVAALIAALLLASPPARADVSAADKAAAEALFDHGKTLMKEGRYPEACSKFQESQRIDPGIGTMLYLADCFEKNGQTASAWAQFLEAAASARAAGQAEREKKARDRASALEPKLNRLTITVAAGAEVPGLEVKRDGVLVGKALWSTAFPVDPGEHTIEAAAPGKKPWAKKIRVDPANLATVTLEIPALEDAPKVEPPKVEPPKVDAPTIGAQPVAPPPSDTPKPPPVKPGPIVSTRDTMPPARIAGGAILGVGIATVAVGGILGMVVLTKKSSIGDQCHDNGICSPGGADGMNTARALATGSNITLISGAGLFVTGVIILAATGPSAPEKNQIFRVEPRFGPGHAGLSVGGSF
ncbi:MAG: hypothetical protein QM820_56300 [Minicystis sp.]